MKARLGILAMALVIALVMAFCALTDETDAPSEPPGPNAILLEWHIARA